MLWKNLEMWTPPNVNMIYRSYFSIFLHYEITFDMWTPTYVKTISQSHL